MNCTILNYRRQSKNERATKFVAQSKIPYNYSCHFNSIQLGNIGCTAVSSVLLPNVETLYKFGENESQQNKQLPRMERNIQVRGKQ